MNGYSAGNSNSNTTQNNFSSTPSDPQKLKPPEITGVVTYPADGIGIAGVDYKELVTGPTDDWGDIRIPYFNPLGSKHLYGENVMYTKNGNITVEILDQYTTTTFRVDGETWNMIIADSDFKVLWLRAYAKKIGATIYNTPGDTAVFHVYDSETSQYWVSAQMQHGYCQLYIVRSDFVPTGRTMKFKTDDYGDNAISFYTDCTNGKLRSVTVTLKGEDNSGISLYCEGDRQYGKYTRLIRKQLGREAQINTKKTNLFIFDDIPVADGQLKWEISCDPLQGSLKPSEITFTINDIADIIPVKYGEQLGMLRVVGVPFGDVEILPGEGVENRHPDFDASYVKGARDRDGNTVFSVSSGYYTVQFGISLNSPLFSIDAPSMMRLIPINAGEITTVTIPRETRLTYGMIQKQFGTFESSAGNIEITNNKDKGDTATVSIVVNDPLERDVFPKKEEVTITENGLKAIVTDIQRENAPADIVLVLDSSGSMKQNMKSAVESAKKFVEKLSDITNISLVQFEQKVIQHKATTREGVIAALDTVKAGGGTALYDAVDTALKLLDGKKKPYIVLFSDGADSRELKNMGEGSNLTKDQILQNISASSVTVLSIGFGKDQDPRALIDMSNASKNGAYFAAVDPAALDNAFAAVSGKLGNQFTITYQRPMSVRNRDSDVPVVSFMIDRSGSMDMDPKESENDVDYRIDKVKNMFHDFILNLPEDTLMQLGSFRKPPMSWDDIYYDQITTDLKAPILQGLGTFFAEGGTPIIPALKTAYSYLSTIPSSKKTLIYFTDAALACEDESEKVQLEEILEKMKKEGFRILFAGLGNDKFAQLYQDAFSEAAQISGGDYVITNDINDIRKKLDELLNKVNQPKESSNTLNFAISLNSRVDDGSRMEYITQKQIENFSVRETSGQVIKPELVKIATGEKYITYNRDASKLLYGSDRPNEDSTVLEYIPYETNTAASGSFSAQNKEMNLTVREAYYMNPFKGIDIGSNYRQFLALNVELSIADGAPIKEYQIPSIFRHFYVSLNNVMSPASEATWLAETPLSEPGNPSVLLSDKTKKSGVLVFMVDRKPYQRIDQLSLHFYDTSYGHISILLAGSVNPNLVEINELPKIAPAELSETFSLAVNGKNDVTELSGISIYQSTWDDSEKNTSFRVLEGKFQSKVQALLNIDPTQRFMYALETDQGPLVTEMNDVVYNIPMGFTGSTMVAPGASVPVRMPFQIPSKLAGNSSYLFADLKTGSVNIPVTSGETYKTGGLGKKWSHEYFDITINALRRASEQDPGTIVLDFTITDKKDGLGLKDISGLIALAKAGSEGKLSEDSAKYFGGNIAVGRNGLGNLNDNYQSASVIPVSSYDDSLYGATSDWAVLDGATRRGILLFRLPDPDISEWTLNFGAIENLSQTIEEAYYEHPALLAKKQPVNRDTAVETKLREAVTAAVAKYQSTRTDANSYVTMGLSNDENVGRQSITPAITIHGRQTLERVAADDDFLQVMYGISCVPTGENYYTTYSSEAIITQGWGTELDLARLAMDMLARLGYQPRILTASLTSVGKENMKLITGLESPDSIPVIAYTDANGEQKMFVIPFMRDISELSGLAYIANNNVYRNNFESWKSRMTITAHAKIVKQPGGAAQVEAFNSLISMFGEEGGDSSNSAAYEDVTLFDKEISYADMSLDAVDISYAPIGKSADGQHEIIAALVDTKQGILYGDKLFMDTSFYNVESITVLIYTQGGEIKHTTYLEKGQKLSDIFQTLAFNLPGLTEDAAETLQMAVNAKAAEGKDAGYYATSKWIGHAAVNRFVRELTNFEQESMPLFGVKAARLVENPLTLMVTTVSDGSKATATVDIMNHKIKVLDNNAEKANKDGFSAVQGIFASILEAYALGEDKAVGFLQVWTKLPEDTPILVIKTDMMNDFAKAFEENGGPTKLVERLREQAQNSKNALFLVPRSPAAIDGKPRYAWLEITEEYNGTRIISVSETGEHSAMAEYIVLNAASFGVKPLSSEGIAGFLYGITCIDWGIATYSLQTQNYAAILVTTKILVCCIQELLAKIELGVDAGSKALNMSPEKYKSMLDSLEALYLLLLKQNKLNIDLNAIHKAAKNFVLLPTFEESDWKKHEFADSAKGYSFSDGFKAAIDAYFPKA